MIAPAPQSKPTAVEGCQPDIVERLRSRAAAHEKASHGSWMGLGYYSSYDAKAMTEAADHIEELTKALRGLDTLLDFSDDNVGQTWTFEDTSSIQEAFAEAYRVLSVPLER